MTINIVEKTTITDPLHFQAAIVVINIATSHRVGKGEEHKQEGQETGNGVQGMGVAVEHARYKWPFLDDDDCCSIDF